MDTELFTINLPKIEEAEKIANKIEEEKKLKCKERYDKEKQETIEFIKNYVIPQIESHVAEEGITKQKVPVCRISLAEYAEERDARVDVLCAFIKSFNDNQKSDAGGYELSIVADRSWDNHVIAYCVYISKSKED